MHKLPLPVTHVPSPVPSCSRESVAAPNGSVELMCTATADALLNLLLIKEVEGSTLADSSSSPTSSFLFIHEDGGPVLTRPPKVNPKGPVDKFVPGGLSLDGFRQNMYNVFIFDVPPKDTDGTVFMVTCGRHVGIFPSWTVTSPYVDKCKGNAFVSAPTVDNSFKLMMDAVDNGTVRWLKG
ncbi:hypothetical protein J3R83DRAFT_11646 [Lanmaoa asiatica]|nr:hypothetical protein J3R83DRAFT_11646 [Lanmaoa asiatica]